MQLSRFRMPVITSSLRTPFTSLLLVTLATRLQFQILTVKLLKFTEPITFVAKQTIRLKPTRNCKHWNGFKCIWKNWWNFAWSLPIRTVLSNEIYFGVRALVTSLLLNDVVDTDTQESWLTRETDLPNLHSDVSSSCLWLTKTNIFHRLFSTHPNLGYRLSS